MRAPHASEIGEENRILGSEAAATRGWWEKICDQVNKGRGIKKDGGIIKRVSAR